jgi:hypothetical protein
MWILLRRLLHTNIININDARPNNPRIAKRFDDASVRFEVGVGVIIKVSEETLGEGLNCDGVVV